MSKIVADIIAIKKACDIIEGLTDEDARLLCWMLAAEIEERERKKDGTKSNPPT